jgi:hypothetical protein
VAARGSAFPMGYAWDRIHREYNVGFLYGSSNASLLVRCIRFSECNPIRELDLVASSIREDAPSPFVSPATKQRIADLVMLYKKWQEQLQASLWLRRSVRLSWSTLVFKTPFEQTT